MGLSPKPQSHPPLKDWDDLDKMLQRNFTDKGRDNFKPAIFVPDYKMSAEEIIQEATRNGYKVEDKGNGYLEFS